MAVREALGLGARVRRDGFPRAAGARGLSGFYFFEEAGAAEAAFGFDFGRHGDAREFETPTVAFWLAGHFGAAFGATGLHVGNYGAGGGGGKGRGGLTVGGTPIGRWVGRVLVLGVAIE